MKFAQLLAVMTGGALGSALRWLLATQWNPLWPPLPLGTLAVNLIGGFVIGLAIGAFDQYDTIAPEWRLFVITGFCGGFTTFSAFSAETTLALMRAQFGWALAIVAAHVLGSLAATLAGIGVVRLLLRT